MIIVPALFSKSFVFKIFPSTPRRKTCVFIFCGFEELFEKFYFRDGLVMNGRPNPK